jgi:hypothetical protein
MMTWIIASIISFFIGVFITRWIFGIPTLINTMQEQLRVQKRILEYLETEPVKVKKNLSSAQEQQMQQAKTRFRNGEITEDEYNSMIATIITS